LCFKICSGFGDCHPLLRGAKAKHRAGAQQGSRERNGDFIAFIDDDEFPAKNWLLSLFQACEKYKVDGVVGPVKRHFDKKPPRWVVEGNFYERPTYATGFVIGWMQGRTNNVLLRRQAILLGEQPFRPEFRSGEDQDFFRRAIARGHTFVGAMKPKFSRLFLQFAGTELLCCGERSFKEPSPYLIPHSGSAKS